MATAYKILGQIDLADTSLNDVYTVPANTESVISTIIVCNRTSSATSFRIALRPNGDTIADSMYIAYDVALDANDSTTLTLGITLDAADVVSVQAGAANAVSVNISGTEITA